MSVTTEDTLPPPDDQSKQCRICFDNENSDEMISPCLCSGGSAYVHRKCLNSWRSENTRGRGFKFCDICQFEYIIETVIPDSEADRKRLLKYHFFVIRDLSSIILLIQAVIIGCAFLLKRIDKNSHNIKNQFPNSIDGFVVYYLSASILLLAIVGLAALIILFIVSITSSNNNSSTSSRRSSSSTNSSSNANGLFGTVVVMVLVCAFVGMIVGIISSVIILRRIMKHYASKLWLRQEADKYIVKDFQGKRNELEKYKKTS